MAICNILCMTMLWLSLCHATPMFYNISMDGSGDDALELIFPTSFSTQAPVDLSATTKTPSFTETITNTLTTTMIRLKDFVLTRVVDFLQENLLIITVVTSVLIVMVFIICCASAMSHKRKLEAYKPLPNPPKKYTGGRKNSGDLHEKPYAVDHVKRVHTQAMASPKTLRAPSKALVGERGRDVRSSPRQEVRKVREVEEVERRRDEPERRREEVERRREVPERRREEPERRREEPERRREEPERRREEPERRREQPREERRYRQDVHERSSPTYSSGSSGYNHPVCTCHLRKAYY